MAAGKSANSEEITGSGALVATHAHDPDPAHDPVIDLANQRLRITNEPFQYSKTRFIQRRKRPPVALLDHKITSIIMIKSRSVFSLLLHSNVFAQEGRNVEILTLHDGRFAFLKATPGDRLELEHFLFGVYLFLFDRF